MNATQHRIGLLFNANKVYDRQVIEGIGHYLQSSKVAWDVFLEEDCLARVNNIDSWDVDGIIADFDDPKMVNSLKAIDIPTIGVGSSYQDETMYPPAHYVATDNFAVIKSAFEHLKRKGIQHLAFYGMPNSPRTKWAKERENAFIALCEQEGFEFSIYLGSETRADSWHESMNKLATWLQSLPTPVGIIAATDARARHLLQVCGSLNLAVPDNVSIVGVDDDDIARNLSRISLSSVSQGCIEMGFKSAQLLHKLLERKHNNAPNLAFKRILVAPIGVVQRQSTDFKALQDPYVIQAMYFIRQNACKGIKVDQVLDFVGISRSNLESRFFEECGHTIHMQIHMEKLKVACDKLIKTKDSLADIASASGYPSTQYMYAIFKKHYGMTPNKYRQING